MALHKDPEENETRQLQGIVPWSGKRVLEIGCGNGRLTWRYAHLAQAVVGIDLDLSDLLNAHRERARHAVAGATFVLADAQALPFPDGSFDVAVLSWSL